MTRKLLIAAIESAATGCGHTFHTGFEYRINNELKQMPALWLIPPRLVKKEGHNRGINHYAVTIKLLEKCREQSQTAKEMQWAEMESNATNICLTLGADPAVRTITNLSLTPQEMSLTNRGEISLEIKFKIELPFCNNTP